MLIVESHNYMSVRITIEIPDEIAAQITAKGLGTFTGSTGSFGPRRVP